LNRRRLLKYAGAVAGVTAASAVGLDYFLKPQQSTHTTTVAPDLTPPVIADFQWKPDASNVHDGMINFTVSDEREVASARLNIVPVFPPEIPSAAIPPESWRDFPSPTPNVALPSGTVQFSQPVSDLKGGKAYTTNIIAKDIAGNQTIQSCDIPYVREFERITARKDISVHALYYHAFGRGGRSWNGTIGTPLLGRYDSSNPFVINRHIDWATGYGIDGFSSDFNGPENLSTTVLRNDFLKSQLLADFKFSISYESQWRLVNTSKQANTYSFDMNDQRNIDTLKQDFEFLAKSFFDHPSYLRIDGRPFVKIYLSRVFSGDVKSAIAQVKQSLASMGYEVYVSGDEVIWNKTPDLNRIKAFDAIHSEILYTWSDEQIRSNYSSKLDELFKKFSSAAKYAGIGFIPSAIPGIDLRSAPWGSPNYEPLPRSEERFRVDLTIADRYLDDNLRMLLLATFNDWNENTYVEPSVQDNFMYLNALRDFLTTNQ
jgi:hypothetical protein